MGTFLFADALSNLCTSQFDIILIAITIKTRYRDKGRPCLTPFNEGTDPDAYLLLIIFQLVPLYGNWSTSSVLQGVRNVLFFFRSKAHLIWIFFIPQIQ